MPTQAFHADAGLAVLILGLLIIGLTPETRDH